jgi:hypothetical protein
MRTSLLTSILASALALTAVNCANAPAAESEARISEEALAGDCKDPLTCETAGAWQLGAKYKKRDRVLGARGNLWECKGGAVTKLCDDAGYEPDANAAANTAWTLVQSCFAVEGPELSTTHIMVSGSQCPSQVTITGIIANDSPFGLTHPIAFYHGANKTLIGVVQVDIPPTDIEASLTEVSVLWNDPTPGSAILTVVADDDGTGKGVFPEANESDNALTKTLTTCP